MLIGGGSAMDSRQWDAARELLAERFLTITIDPRGIGGSENPTANYSDADDMIAVLDHLGLEAALFAGGSAAGATVLEVALAHPERMIGGVTIAPFLAGFEPSPEMATRFKRFGAAAGAGGDAFVEVVRDDPHFLPAPKRPEAREIAWKLIRETFARTGARWLASPILPYSSGSLTSPRPCFLPPERSIIRTSAGDSTTWKPPCPAPSECLLPPLVTPPRWRIRKALSTRRCRSSRASAVAFGDRWSIANHAELLERDRLALGRVQELHRAAAPGPLRAALR